jgi:alpha-D-ribose 1-methylphosphonate 5-triphosphate synthase subunit PhnL
MWRWMTLRATAPLDAEDPEIVARLLLGALTRGAMLIATDKPQDTRNAVAQTIRAFLDGLSIPAKN